MRMKTLVAAAALLISGAVSAQAATITPGDVFSYRATVGTLAGSNTLDVSFAWAETPVTGYQVFSVSSAFELVLSAYNVVSNTATNLQTTGWVLKVMNNGVWENLTTATTNCVAAQSEVSGSCNHIASAAYNGSVASSKPGTTLSAGGKTSFGAGTYLLGIYDSSAPSAASATFRVAAVPLPATGLALIAGLGGLAALGARRRRAQA